MKLSFEQIKSVTVGAVQLYEDSAGLHFYKMTPRQLDAFGALSGTLLANASSSSGIRLDFHTNSKYIKYSTLTSGKYEVKIDGLLSGFIRATEDSETEIRLSEDGTSHRVTLHLPSHGLPAGLKYIELEDGSELTPHIFDRRFLFIGDSITHGWNSQLDTMSFAYQTSDHFNAESIIQGTGGAYFDVTTIEKLDFDPDTVIVAYGTNDSNKFSTLDEISSRASVFLKKLMEFYPEAKICVITPIWRLDYDTAVKAYGHVSLAADAIGNAARALGLKVIDGMKMIPPHEIFMANNLHPNDLGFSVYAHNLIKALEN